jgi:hypothetical protein
VYLETRQTAGEFEYLGQVFDLLSALPTLRVFRWVCHGYEEHHPADAPWDFVPAWQTFSSTLKMAKRGVDVKVMTTFAVHVNKL